MLNVIMLTVVMLNVIMPSAVMLNVTMWSVKGAVVKIFFPFVVATKLARLHVPV
jgi:hypothetical protein